MRAGDGINSIDLPDSQFTRAKRPTDGYGMKVAAIANTYWSCVMLGLNHRAGGPMQTAQLLRLQQRV